MWLRGGARADRKHPLLPRRPQDCFQIAWPDGRGWPQSCKVAISRKDQSFRDDGDLTQGSDTCHQDIPCLGLVSTANYRKVLWRDIGHILDRDLAALHMLGGQVRDSRC